MNPQSHTSLHFDFVCPLSSGLHARPASYLAEVANEFASECAVTNLRNGLRANLKSVLGIIAADIRHGDHCAVYISGADEQFAHSKLRRFVEDELARCDVPLVETSSSSPSRTPPRTLQAANATCIFGTPVSRGIGQGKVLIFRRISLPSIKPSAGKINGDKELLRIEQALAAVRQRIEEKLKYSLTPVGTAVLQADLAMAGDVFLVEKLREQILQGKSASQAVVHAGEFFIDLLGHSENEYIRQRAADIEEICLQLLEEVDPTAHSSAIIELSEPSVLVAEMLAPQQLLEIDQRWLKAIVLEHSATTSHAAILARSLGIPTLAGVRNARMLLTEGREIVVDAIRGFAVAQISPDVQRFYDRQLQTLERRKSTRSGEAASAANTPEHAQLEVGANASTGEELTLAFENGADGIGLFRTEMLFLGRDKAPSEEEQFAIYSQAARAAAGKPVIIRTFDIGGDKQVPYLNISQEENPFLGYRGARLYSEHQHLLQTQLRSILRASTSGQVQIMAPMISSPEEFIQFKNSVADAKQGLEKQSIAFHRDLKVGMMIEVPSVAYMLDRFCAEADFFSIGTNDLLQYFFAADRGNSAVASGYSPRHPAFLRLLRQIVQPIRQAGKWIGMCGEMAADPRNLPLLIGLHIDEVSVPAAEVHDLKRSVLRLRAEDCASILESAISRTSTQEVEDLLLARHPAQLEPLLSEKLVLLGSSSRTKDAGLQEMVDAFFICGRTQDRNLFEEALWAREAVYSTGLGYGFATPHCKTDAVSADSICVLRLQDPIHWGSVDGEPVRMVVLLALRDSEDSNTHMQVFSTLARKLMNDDFRKHLLQFETANQITRYLAGELGLDAL